MAMDIKQEALTKKYKLTDIKNFRDLYKTDVIMMDSTLLSALKDNYHYLLANSQIIEWKERYRYKPEYVAIDKYNDSNLWFVVCFMNNVFMPEEFELQQIILPDYSALMNILNTYTPETVEINIDPGGLI